MQIWYALKNRGSQREIWLSTCSQLSSSADIIRHYPTVRGMSVPGADLGFPVGRRGPIVGGGHGPPTWVLFSENVCENERTGFRRRGVRQKILYVSANMFYSGVG